MTDRDRLIELMSHKQQYGIATEEPPEAIYTIENHQLADYLLANGVIVPPCKAGDKIYFIDTCTTAEDFGKQYVSWGEVLQLSFNRFGEWVILTDKRLIITKKGIFLTKEEAEAKLKELSK